MGDGGNRQALIRTIHKPGFRFVGAIAERATVPAAETVTPARQPAPVAVAPPADACCRPSIVVLPPGNLGPDTDCFSYGLTEDPVRMLARNRWIDVLSRDSPGSSARPRRPSGDDVPPRDRARSGLRAHGALSRVHLQSSVLGDPTERARLLREALEQARIAAALDNQDSMTLCMLGPAHRFLHEYEAIELLEQSIVLDPGFVICWRVSGDSGVRRPRKPRQPTRSRSRSTSIGSSVPASS